jgi:phthiocerol/phenolphthiocerol synthesis type-I polyketide synthase E
MKKLVFLLPGLGNHYLNMGRGLYEQETVFRTAVDRCAALLQAHLELDIRRVIFAATAVPDGGNRGLDLRKMLRREETSDPAALRLQETVVAQPALFTIEYALAQLLAARGIQPAALLGYSLGEYVAAHLAGVFSLEDALYLVAARARLMQALPPGKMLAVPLTEAELRPYLNQSLSISAINGDQLCVVAGQPEGVSALAAALAGQAIAAQTLPTTHAFHTELMRPIAAEFLAAARAVNFAAPRLPYVSNLTGDWVTADQATSPEYWLEHCCRPVRFAGGMATLRQAGYDVFLEVGPGQALSSLILGLNRDERVTAVPTMRYEYDGQPDTAVWQQALQALQGENVGRPSLSGNSSGSDARFTEQETAVMDEVEQQLHDIWRKLLKVEAFDGRRSFFELGGNSLLATQLIFRLRKAFRVDISLRTIFEAPTIGELAAVVRNKSEQFIADSEQLARIGRPSSVVRGQEVTLPNGLVVACQSKAEAAHFYEDIFAHRNYVQHGNELPPGSCVFDVGGNIGLFTLFVHLNCPDARIFTFEPAPPLFALLQENVARHGVAAQLFPYALSRASGTAELTYYPLSSGMSSLYPDLAEEQAVLKAIIDNQIRRGETELAALLPHAEEYLAERFKQEVFTCPVRTVSEMMAETAVSHIQLLKIDVQKSEYGVLLGINEADWPKIEQIVIEVHDIGGQLSTIRQLLAGKGYRVAVEQDALYAGSVIYNLYAVRE